MSKTVWKEQADKWCRIEGNWQGRHNIIDQELENDIERIAGVISWIFLNMSKGYARRYRTLDILKKRYAMLAELHKDVVNSYIENDWICANCGDQVYFPEYDVEGLEDDAHFDCGCPADKRKAAKDWWAGLLDEDDADEWDFLDE